MEIDYRLLANNHTESHVTSKSKGQGLWDRNYVLNYVLAGAEGSMNRSLRSCLQAGKEGSAESSSRMSQGTEVSWHLTHRRRERKEIQVRELAESR